MATPLSATGASPQPHAWQELEDVFARLGQLARSAVAPSEFYRSLLEESIRALSAVGGIVWLRAGDGPLQPSVQANWPSDAFANDEQIRRAHQLQLANAAAEGRVASITPRDDDSAAETGNPTTHRLVIAPVSRIAQEESGIESSHTSETLAADSQTLAIIEFLVRADASPAMHRGCEEFLRAVCELASDFHAFHDLRNLQRDDHYRAQLLGLSRESHRQLNLAETAYAVANEGRRVVGCDRLSVLVARGRRCRLLATSGVSRPERRSGAARRLERLAELIRNTDEPAYYDDGQSDGLPPVAEALEQHAEESHARIVAAVPIRPAADPATADDRSPKDLARSASLRPQFVLVAEQFDARRGGLSRDRLVEVADVATTALYNALQFDRLPMAWLWKPLGAVKQQVSEHLSRTALLATAFAAAVAALIIIPADFDIEAPGTLVPVVQRDVFAPRSGLVDAVLVAHGETVNAGQALVELRDPALDLELKRVDGELATAQRQLDAVQATRTNRAVRDANPVDAYRLSAEEREIEQRLENLRRELELLNRQRDQLVVASPIAGRVLTWDVKNRLLARPVERGEVLVTVADVSDDWQLELEVPDDRIGYVLAAQQELEPSLPVRFRLSSDDRERHEGHIAEVCQTVDVASGESTAPSPTVLVKVALDTPELAKHTREDLRPGISARAQIACGQRPLGYVWFHDIWDAAIEWLRF